MIVEGFSMFGDILGRLLDSNQSSSKTIGIIQILQKQKGLSLNFYPSEKLRCQEAFAAAASALEPYSVCAAHDPSIQWPVKMKPKKSKKINLWCKNVWEYDT